MDEESEKVAVELAAQGVIGKRVDEPLERKSKKKM